MLERDNLGEYHNSGCDLLFWELGSIFSFHEKTVQTHKL